MKDELVQYFIVNEELDMSKGKIAAQVAHAATIATAICISKEYQDFYDWFHHSQAKVVLKAKEKELKKLKSLGYFAVIDEGRTEIPSGSLTVVALPPMLKSEAQKIVKRYRLL